MAEPSWNWNGNAIDGWTPSVHRNPDAEELFLAGLTFRVYFDGAAYRWSVLRSDSSGSVIYEQGERDSGHAMTQCETWWRRNRRKYLGD
jgi:hypothetical protein